MNVLERFIVSRCEKHLQRYRDNAKHARAEFLNQYNLFLPEIERCYGQAGYWHGTGRYHYLHTNDSRYEGINSERTSDVLSSILEQGGLAGHQDLWVKIGDQTQKTVSIAPSRMHSRLYAHIHLREGVWLEYVFGGTRFWMSLIVILVIKELLFKFGKKEERAFVKKTVLNRNSPQHFQTWANAIRRFNKFRIFFLFRAYELRSDIKGNYSILFGIKRSSIVGSGILPFIKKFEVRIPGPVQLESMTHVEVPLENVEETRRLFAAKGIRLPIIPLEFGELYCSRLPLTQLVYV